MLKMAQKGWRSDRLFNRLPVRHKLIVLHNCFFLVLALSLYFALRTPLNRVAAQSGQEELQLLAEIFQREPAALQRFKSDLFTFVEGSAEELGISREMQQLATSDPSHVWRREITAPKSSLTETFSTGRLLRYDPDRRVWQLVAINSEHYEHLAKQLRLMLGLALVGVYALAVMVLELLILPRYVYHPIRRLLRADEALQSGARSRELIDPAQIPGDELGQIMASRNATVTLLRRHEDELTAALARLEEMTNDLKRKNHTLETAKQNLASQDRLVSLGLMSAGVAHELNTPLAVLHGSIEKMLEAPPAAPDLDRLRRMLRVTERLRAISESLTDFARARTQKMERLALRPLLQEAWSLVEIELRGAEVEFDNRASESDLVTGNSGRLLQVFVNLFRNGTDAIKEGLKSAGQTKSTSGKLSVHTRRVTQDQREWLVIAVEDDGPGIPPEVLPHVFEPFVTSRLDARGTGLGLAVSEGIIHQHGGLIVASNRRAGGARFEVTLPAEAAGVPA